MRLRILVADGSVVHGRSTAARPRDADTNRYFAKLTNAQPCGRVPVSRECQKLLNWLRRRREAARLAQADAAALVREQGGDEAYWRALEIARDMVLANVPTRQGRTPDYWKQVAYLIGKETGRPVISVTSERRDPPRPHESSAVTARRFLDGG